MNENVRKVLDGELPRSALDDAALEDLALWEQALDELKADAPAHAPLGLEDRIMAEVGSLAEGTALPDRQRTWLLRPRTLRVTPLTGLLAAAAVAGLILWPQERPASSPSTEVFVQFSLEAPGATSVAVAGDFSEWEGLNALTDVDGDGVWTGRIRLEPGVHQYMFVIDGSDWVTDPRAERYSDDGFGNRNAVIAVEAPTPDAIG